MSCPWLIICYAYATPMAMAMPMAMPMAYVYDYVYDYAVNVWQYVLIGLAMPMPMA